MNAIKIILKRFRRSKSTPLFGNEYATKEWVQEYIKNHEKFDVKVHKNLNKKYDNLRMNHIELAKEVRKKSNQAELYRYR